MNGIDLSLRLVASFCVEEGAETRAESSASCRDPIRTARRISLDGGGTCSSSGRLLGPLRSPGLQPSGTARGPVTPRCRPVPPEAGPEKNTPGTWPGAEGGKRAPEGVRCRQATFPRGGSRYRTPHRRDRRAISSRQRESIFLACSIQPEQVACWEQRTQPMVGGELSLLNRRGQPRQTQYISSDRACNIDTTQKGGKGAQPSHPLRGSGAILSGARQEGRS